MTEQSFGNDLRRLRRASGKTLADLADALGCSIAYMSDVERGRKNPPGPRDVEKLMEVVNAKGETARMLGLAAKGRRTVEFQVSDQAEGVMGMLVALERRCEARDLPDDVVEEIRRLLEQKRAK